MSEESSFMPTDRVLLDPAVAVEVCVTERSLFWMVMSAWLPSRQTAGRGRLRLG